MSDLTECTPDIPGHVHTAAALTLFLAGCAAVLAVPALLVGSFVGPQILVPGIMSAILAPVLILSRRGLLRRRWWARWLLVVLSSLGALAISGAVGQEIMAGTIDAVGSTIFFGVSMLFAVIASTLLTGSASAWFAGQERSFASPEAESRLG